MKIKTLLAAIGLFAAFESTAEITFDCPTILVNKDVTTHIIMPENIKLVDLSTDRIVGDQCADNMLRLKPVTDTIAMQTPPMEGDFMGAVTLIGERHMAQYNLIYTTNPMRSNSMYKVKYATTDNYANPEVPMTEAEMANYAWAISNTGRKFHTVRSKAFGIDAQIYNIYSMGGFFFLDLVLENNRNIPYDIAQMRITLSDKKETKATNSQTLELTPAFVLNKETSFKKNYRQVIVLPKLTYPEEKVLTIEITEDPISGRVISLPIQYEDILHADCFNGNKDDAYTKVQAVNLALNNQINKLNDKLKVKEKEIRNLKDQNQKRAGRYVYIRKKMAAMEKVYKDVMKIRDMFPESIAESLDSDPEIKTQDFEIYSLESE